VPEWTFDRRKRIFPLTLTLKHKNVFVTTKTLRFRSSVHCPMMRTITHIAWSLSLIAILYHSGNTKLRLRSCELKRSCSCSLIIILISIFSRYKSLCPSTWPSYTCTHREGVDQLCKYLDYKEGEYRLGKTKIFIRFPRTLFATEDAFQVILCDCNYWLSTNVFKPPWLFIWYFWKFVKNMFCNYWIKNI